MDLNSKKTVKVRIITKSKMKYEGELCTIDKENKTISLKHVRSFGTEGRRSDIKINGVESIFQCIVYKSSEIEDLAVLKKEIPRTKDRVILLDVGEKGDGDSALNRGDMGQKEYKGEGNDLDLEALFKQTKESGMKEVKTNKRGVVVKEECYSQKEFFDSISSSTGKMGRGTDDNYTGVEINQKTFDLDTVEIQKSVKEIRDYNTTKVSKKNYYYENNCKGFITI